MAPAASRQRSIAKACGTGGAVRRATPRVWGADRRASGAQPAAATGQGCAGGAAIAGCPGAKEWRISTCRTVPGAKGLLTPPDRRFPLGQAGESFALADLCARAAGITPRGLS